MDINADKITQIIVDRVMEENDFAIIASRVITDKIINSEFSSQINGKVTEAIDLLVKEGFSKTYQKVNSFGEPDGEPTSIKKELQNQIDTYWSTRVDRNGKPCDSYVHNSTTRAEYLMTVICANDFTEQVKQSALNITGHLKDGLRVQMASQMDVLLNSLFKVKSLQDQGKVEKPY